MADTLSEVEIDGSDYPLSRYGMGAFRIALEAVYKVSKISDIWHLGARDIPGLTTDINWTGPTIYAIREASQGDV